MKEIYLAYAREDIDRATDIVEALEAEGFSVFFDAAIRVGTEWDEVL